MTLATRIIYIITRVTVIADKLNHPIYPMNRINHHNLIALITPHNLCKPNKHNGRNESNYSNNLNNPNKSSSPNNLNNSKNAYSHYKPKNPGNCNNPITP